MIPDGMYWNQAELDEFDQLNNGLISIIAFGPDLEPLPIGSGFLMAAFGDRAAGCSVAHVFEHVRKLDAPRSRHHPSALKEFLPSGVPLNIDKTRLRALSFERGQVEMATFDWVIWDERTDLAFFGVRIQQGTSRSFFQSELQLDPHLPEVGSEVAVLGFRGMSVVHFEKNAEKHSFKVGRELVLRGGRITKVFLNGHLLCHGPCVETTIPIFPGMSGAPVMRFAPGMPMQPFGVMSSDPTEDPALKLDRSSPGHSIVPLINPSVSIGRDGQRMTMLRLDSGMHAGRSW